MRIFFSTALPRYSDFNRQMKSYSTNIALMRLRADKDFTCTASVFLLVRLVLCAHLFDPNRAKARSLQILLFVRPLFHTQFTGCSSSQLIDLFGRIVNVVAVDMKELSCGTLAQRRPSYRMCGIPFLFRCFHLSGQIITIWRCREFGPCDL